MSEAVVHRGSGGKYWEYLGEGEFRLPRCPQCKRWNWPAQWRCSACGCWDLEWIEVEPVGNVYTWTRTWYVFDGVKERADDIPYVVIRAELPTAGGSQVLGVLEGSEEGLKIGTPVRGHILPASAKTKGYPTLVWRLAD
jgi:uncharacterized OB-fold protein